MMRLVVYIFSDSKGVASLSQGNQTLPELPVLWEKKLGKIGLTAAAQRKTPHSAKNPRLQVKQLILKTTYTDQQRRIYTYTFAHAGHLRVPINSGNLTICHFYVSQLTKYPPLRFVYQPQGRGYASATAAHDNKTWKTSYYMISEPCENQFILASIHHRIATN